MCALEIVLSVTNLVGYQYLRIIAIAASFNSYCDKSREAACTGEPTHHDMQDEAPPERHSLTRWRLEDTYKVKYRSVQIVKHELFDLYVSRETIGQGFLAMANNTSSGNPHTTESFSPATELQCFEAYSYAVSTHGCLRFSNLLISPAG
jgi:hypothetical protein